jgi:hypothetical protein
MIKTNLSKISKEPYFEVYFSKNRKIKTQIKNLEKHSVKFGTIYSREKITCDDLLNLGFIETAKNINGIIVYEDKDFITIGVDPFRTVPIFLCDDNGLFISSDIRFCRDYIKSIEFDIASFWEIIKFGVCFGTRTLFKNIKQIPGASFIKIRKSDLSYKIDHYWNYKSSNNKKINTISDAVSGLDKIMSQTVKKKLNNIKNKNFIMGITGGLDSRLSLNYLSQYLNPKQLKLFTFSDNYSSLEYSYAKQVVDAVDFTKPMFFKLNDKEYSDALEDLPIRSAGHISFIHGHISNCLKKLSNENEKLQISNYFSDAIFGWCCFSPVEEAQIGLKRMVYEIEKDNDISNKTKQIIIKDLKDIFRRGKFLKEGNGSFSSFYEYIYLAEINIKMHSYLMHLQSTSNPLLSLYTDFKLLVYMLSVPVKFRNYKNVVMELLEKKSRFSKKNLPNISSRDFFGSTNKLTFFSFRGIEFKIRTWFNTVLSPLGFKLDWLVSSYQTENYHEIYNRIMRKKILNERNYLVKKGFMNNEVAISKFKKIKFKDVYTNLKMLSIARGIRKFKVKKT